MVVGCLTHVAPRGGLACLPDPLRSRAGTARFLRDARLTGSAQFQRVFRRTQLRSSDAVLTVLATANKLASPRLGLAISRKAAHRAVARNRIKRLIRESFRTNRQNLPALDIVVIGKPGFDKKTNMELREALERHWKYLSQQCKKS